MKLLTVSLRAHGTSPMATVIQLGAIIRIKEVLAIDLYLGDIIPTLRSTAR